MKYGLFQTTQQDFIPIATLPLTSARDVVSAEKKMLKSLNQKWDWHWVGIVDDADNLQLVEMFADLTNDELKRLETEDLNDIIADVFERIEYNFSDTGLFGLEIANENKSVKWLRLKTKEEIKNESRHVHLA